MNRFLCTSFLIFTIACTAMEKTSSQPQQKPPDPLYVTFCAIQQIAQVHATIIRDKKLSPDHWLLTPQSGTTQKKNEKSQPCLRVDSVAARTKKGAILKYVSDHPKSVITIFGEVPLTDSIIDPKISLYLIQSGFSFASSVYTDRKKGIAFMPIVQFNKHPFPHQSNDLMLPPQPLFECTTWDKEGNPTDGRYLPNPMADQWHQEANDLKTQWDKYQQRYLEELKNLRT